MEFLEPHEKVKKLRKVLKMTQHDLQDETITRGLISMIELGKRNITRETASILTQKFKSRAKEMEVDLDIDDEYLLRDSVKEAEYYCMKKLKNNPSKEEIEAILDIAERYKNKLVKAEAIMRTADIYYDNNEYYDSFILYMEALDLHNKISDISNHGYIYNRLGVCKSRSSDYLEALMYYNKAYVYSKDTKDINTLKKSLYNIGRTYKKLGKYDGARYYLNEYIDIIDKDSEFKNYAYACILIASCYESENQPQKTIAIYDKLISMCKETDDELLGYIYNNLGILYSNLEILEESMKYFDLAIIKKQHISRTSPVYTYVSKAQTLVKMKEYNAALDLIYEGLSLSKEREDEELQFEIYYTLADIYLHMGDIKNLKKLYLNLTHILKDSRKYDLVKIYAKLADIALQEGDIEECKEYIKLIQGI